MADPIPRRPDATKATLTNEVFDDPDWIVERKLDGFRCLAFRDGGAVALESRNRLSLNERYPGGRGGARGRAVQALRRRRRGGRASPAGARASRRCSGAGTTAT